MMSSRSFLEFVADSGIRYRRIRGRINRRCHIPPGRLPRPFDRAWPVMGPDIPRVARWPMNSARFYQARLSWPLFGPIVRGCRRTPLLLARLVGWVTWISWAAVTACMYAAAVVVAVAGLVIVWAPTYLLRSTVRVALVWHGWIPPNGIGSHPALSGTDLAAVMDALPPPPPEPTIPTADSVGSVDHGPGDEVDPWDFNHRADPWAEQQERLIDEIRRANDIAERNERRDDR